MDYKGPERRKKEEPFYCDAHLETKETLILLENNFKHMAESIGRIDKHLEEASKTRTAWWLAISSLVVGIVIQSCILSYFGGTMVRQIEVNSKRLDSVEVQVYQKEIITKPDTRRNKS